MSNQQIYGTAELAKAAGVSREWVRLEIVSGNIDAEKIGQTWVIPKDEGDRWLREREAQPKEPA